MEANHSAKTRFSFSMFLVTIGIVYGDIGTSPMYVMKSILEGNQGITQVDEAFIIGSLSLIIWTITLLTTIKYVLIAMKADNHGEGGIFSLYSLVRKYYKWLIIPAMVGGAALLADGVLTPAVTVTTAVEGLRSISFFDHLLGPGQAIVILITLLIIGILFAIQRSGTSAIGKMFGPVMLIWFSFLGLTGLIQLMGNLNILAAFNPIHAIRLLLSPTNKSGFMILGSVFLAATGAEALYSDMGHVGKSNIYFSWPFVKVCLILNYMGQGAWITRNISNTALHHIEDLNPFYLMLPTTLRPVAILLGAAAAVIASQALITGSYTLVSEAIGLDLMPHMQIRYPSETKGQMYIPIVNNVLWIGCSFVVLYFRSSTRMESAYGLAITVTMLMTTTLLVVYMAKLRGKVLLSMLLAVVFGAIEMVFFISSLGKFAKGGYFAACMALLLFIIMVTWYQGTQIERLQLVNLSMRDHIDSLKKLRDDPSIPKIADNLVFLVRGSENEMIDRDVLYSILDKDTKKASAYWFLTVNTMEDPNVMNYTVETYGTDFIYRVQLNLGYKINQKVNVYLRQIVGDLLESGELPPQNKKYSIYGPSKVGSFKFCMIRKTLPGDSDLSSLNQLVIRTKYAIRRVVGSPSQWYGLENSSVIIEYVPLFLKGRRETQKLERVDKEDIQNELMGIDSNLD